MPIFRTTENIFKDSQEFFDENWMDRETLYLPESPDWDYSREMNIEDVDIWEVIYEGPELLIYASWCPYAEFYMVVNSKNFEINTFYGQGAQKRMKRYIANKNVFLNETLIWVEPEQEYLY